MGIKKEEMQKEMDAVGIEPTTFHRPNVTFEHAKRKSYP